MNARQPPVLGMRAAQGRRLLVAARVCASFVAVALARGIQAQQPATPMGAVATRDAKVTGGLEVQGDFARLLANTSVTAFDHDASVTLNRGGRVLVCSTSEFHLLRSGGSGGLIFGLDRGGLEISTETQLQDAVLTPDLKFTPVTKGPLALRLRVTREGDTCVENSGATAPVLNVTDPFSSATYRVLPGQHLLFVKGDLHKVVDHERSACGCPAAGSPTQLAGKPLSGAQAAAAAAHPFPEAQSAGLAPTADAGNQAAPETAGTQVSTTFSYGEGEGRSPAADQTPAAGTAVPGAASGPKAAPRGGLFHALGRFFHRLFGGS